MRDLLCPQKCRNRLQKNERKNMLAPAEGRRPAEVARGVVKGSPARRDLAQESHEAGQGEHPRVNPEALDVRDDAVGHVACRGVCVTDKRSEVDNTQLVRDAKRLREAAPRPHGDAPTFAELVERQSEESVSCVPEEHEVAVLTAEDEDVVAAANRTSEVKVRLFLALDDL